MFETGGSRRGTGSRPHLAAAQEALAGAWPLPGSNLPFRLVAQATLDGALVAPRQSWHLSTCLATRCRAPISTRRSELSSGTWAVQNQVLQGQIPCCRSLRQRSRLRHDPAPDHHLLQDPGLVQATGFTQLQRLASRTSRMQAGLAHHSFRQGGENRGETPPRQQLWDTGTRSGQMIAQLMPARFQHDTAAHQG